MIRAKQIATSVAAAFALGYGATASALVSAPGAVAESMWTQSLFRVCAGDGVSNLSTAASCASATAPVFHPTIAGAVISGNGITFDTIPLIGGEEAGASARVNATSTALNPPQTNLGVGFTVSQVVGAGFTPGTPIPAAAPTGQYAGGISQSGGFALSPAGASVLMHSQTQINTGGSDGSATSAQTLTSTFEFQLVATTTFELSWDGTLKLRAGLGQTGGTPSTNFANADGSLSFSVFGDNGACEWSPDGNVTVDAAGDPTQQLCSGGASGFEFSDAFNYQGGAGRLVFAGDTNPALQSGYFEAEFTLPAGFYTFTIAGQTQANAAVVPLPEPHSLALLGLGLLGLGFAARRKVRSA